MNGGVSGLEALRIWGTVRASDGVSVRIAGLSAFARLGDHLAVGAGGLRAEVVAIDRDVVTAMLMGPGEGLAAGARADLVTEAAPKPSPAWCGHVVDAFGRLADGSPAPEGEAAAALRHAPPRAASRRALGGRIGTGLAATDTMLPLCRGQRLGVFAGSGVGKSMLLGALARGVEADRVVIGLIGERGREVGDFVHRTLGRDAMARAVVVAATSDQTALVKRRAALLAMAVAEHFRDAGEHVLLLVDSLTRYAEAHREIALAAGEAPALRAFPPSTGAEIAQLCERAGPGSGTQGDITAVFTVLVAGSDMEEPVADMVRGVLDGHVVLDRAIAERGRYPAIDLCRSVSRSAPGAWTPQEAALAGEARRLTAAYEEAAPMIQAGLYQKGSDPLLDRAVALWPALDAFVGRIEEDGPEASFAALAEILGSAPAGTSERSERSEKA